MVNFRGKTAVVLLFLIIIAILLAVFPFLWIMATSFKYYRDIMSSKIFFNPTLINYFRLFTETDFLRLAFNSLIVSISATFGTVIIGALAAYSFSKFSFPWNIDKYIFAWLLFVRMIVPISLAIPFFLIMKKMNLLNTPLALIVVYIVINVPFGVWMLKDFFDNIPGELLDAGRIDGCSEFGVFARVALPLITPGLAAATIFVFILNWNHFLYALILTSSPEGMTIPVGIARLSQQYMMKWGEMSAAATVFAVPVFVFASLVQKHLVRGLTFGAVKG